MKKILYHGTTSENALSILRNGFDLSKCGTNWGSTYGKGIYFTPYHDTAKVYAGDEGIVLSFILDIEPYYLEKDVSPSKKAKLRIPDGYNCLVNPNKDEYVFYKI